MVFNCSETWLHTNSFAISALPFGQDLTHALFTSESQLSWIIFCKGTSRSALNAAIGL